MKYLTIDPTASEPPTRDLPAGAKMPESLPDAKETRVHPSNVGGENARLLFVGTATTILYVSIILPFVCFGKMVGELADLWYLA